MTDLDAIRKRLTECPIPEDARADWEGTNHYEIQSPRSDGWWWLDDIGDCLDSHTDGGRRLGAVLDYAVAYRRDVKALLEEIERLRGNG